jgi:hypothetical protein
LNEILNLKHSFSIFSEIILKEEFYKLNKDQLIKIISKDHISVESEMVILKSVIRWINFDKENRIKYLSEVIRHVRLPLMEKEELYELLSFSLFKNSEEMLLIVREAIELQINKPQSNDQSSKIDLAFIRPRISQGLPSVRLFRLKYFHIFKIILLLF